MRQRFRDDRNAARLATGLVAYALDVTAESILSDGRGRNDVSRARQVAMYLAHVGFGMSLARVANAFDRDRSTVAHACHVIEDCRDDADFDAWMERLETGLGILAPLSRKAA